MRKAFSSSGIMIIVATALWGGFPAAEAKPVDADITLVELKTSFSFELHGVEANEAFDFSKWMMDNGSGGFPDDYSDENRRLDPFETRPD